MLSYEECNMQRLLLQATLLQAVKEETRIGPVLDETVCQSAGPDVVDVQVQNAVDSAEVVWGRICQEMHQFARPKQEEDLEPFEEEVSLLVEESHLTS